LLFLSETLKLDLLLIQLILERPQSLILLERRGLAQP
jgi:hypothetical protein